MMKLKKEEIKKAVENIIIILKIIKITIPEIIQMYNYVYTEYIKNKELIEKRIEDIQKVKNEIGV